MGKGQVKNLSFIEKFTILCEFMSNPSHRRRLNFSTKAFLLAITVLNSSAVSERSDIVVDTVVIDAGHGGKDPGTRGVNLKEKDVALKIALKVGGYIEKNIPGVKVIYTRKTDKYIPLDERADIANKNKADLFICIHANAVSNPDIVGTETYVMGLQKAGGNLDVSKRENSVIMYDENYEERYEGFDPNSAESNILMSVQQGAYLESSLSFAGKVESEFKTKIGRKSKGVKQAPFWVLWRTAMPSVLIEVGFLTNKKEEVFLSEEAGQNLIASGIYRAFKDYKAQVESIN
ncbi:hypothetical protein BH09BAC3_BH09BAC3_04470 [soil metagenome]